MEWIFRTFDWVTQLTRAHVYLSLVPLVLGLAIAIPIAGVVHKEPRVRRLVRHLATIAFTIPALAMLVFVPSIFAMGIADPLNVVITMTIYTVALLLRTLPDALDSVPYEVVDSANSLGYSPLRRFLTVELPLALPALFSATRVAAVTNIGLVTVAAILGVGGLGRLFTDGYQNRHIDEVVAGVIAIALLGLAVDLLLYLVGRALTPWARLRRPSREERRAIDEAGAVA